MTKMSDFLARGTTRFFQPEASSRAKSTVDSKIQRRLTFLVGLVAFLLPVSLVLGAWIGQTCFRDSISHFYYAQFLGSIFVGCLVFIGGFLIAYTGEHWLEDFGSMIAGFGAIFVGLFPTTGTGCEEGSQFTARVFVDVTQETPLFVQKTSGENAFQLFENVANLHVYAAATLFVYLGLYCLFVLRRIVPERHIDENGLTAPKRRRNTFYFACGFVILVCVAILGYVGLLADPEWRNTHWDTRNLTFVVETVALWAFGSAWFAKSRLFGFLND